MHCHSDPVFNLRAVCAHPIILTAVCKDPIILQCSLRKPFYVHVQNKIEGIRERDSLGRNGCVLNLYNIPLLYPREFFRDEMTDVIDKPRDQFDLILSFVYFILFVPEAQLSNFF